MKVLNRSDSNVTYSLPELNIRRVFSVGESKDVEPAEMDALFAKDGGAELIKHFLMVEDKDWVKAHFDAPIEYFWSIDKVRKCILEDPLDLFEETLDFAPRGVIDLIKNEAWQLPLSDLNKIDALYQKTGFNVQVAIKNMRPLDGEQKVERPKQRRRREED